jgi:hypothetical protein
MRRLLSTATKETVFNASIISSLLPSAQAATHPKLTVLYRFLYNVAN